MLKKTEAIGLLDAKVRRELVDIGDGQMMEIYGLSGGDIAALFERFPPLQMVVMGRGVKPDELLKLGPEIVAALCAASAHLINNAEAEQKAAQFSIETQLDILEAMGRCTFTRGFGPFAQRIRDIAGALSVEGGKAPDMKSSKPSKLSAEPPTQPSGN